MSFPNFLLLPPELQVKIFESLEEHLNPLCTFDEDAMERLPHFSSLLDTCFNHEFLDGADFQAWNNGDFLEDHFVAVGRPTLVALSRVSGHFRQLALPLLYRRIHNVQSWCRRTSKQNTIFAGIVRTTLESNSLADGITELLLKECSPFGNGGVQHHPPIPDDVQYNLYCLAANSNMWFGDAFYDSLKTEFASTQFVALIQILLTRLKSLEKLCLDFSAGYHCASWEPFAWFVHEMSHTQTGWTLSRLKTLQLTHQGTPTSILAGLSISSEFYNSTRELMLLHTCANLEDLTMDLCIRVESPLQLPRLKHLVLKDSFLPIRDFENLVESCGSLEEFTYHSVTARENSDDLALLNFMDREALIELDIAEATPRQMVKALKHHSQTLKRLDLRRGQLPNDTKGDISVIGFSDFSRLELLTLKGYGFIHAANRANANHPGDKAPRGRFSYMMPQEVRRVDVDNIEPFDVCALAKDMEYGYYPHVEAISLGPFHQHLGGDFDPSAATKTAAALESLQNACDARDPLVTFDWTSDRKSVYGTDSSMFWNGGELDPAI